jgi:hypothetical protein
MSGRASLNIGERAATFCSEPLIMKLNVPLAA